MLRCRALGTLWPHHRSAARSEGLDHGEYIEVLTVYAMREVPHYAMPWSFSIPTQQLL
eukprot:COSAG06_NODE_42995_length_376_cov_0.913357_1_plen_57_part_01